jgi:DNA-directed RNA polymerase subunit RPC12/RpoP
MTTVRTMRAVQGEEIPVDGGTAVQESPDRPVFRGNGEFDYVCASCGSLLAAGMEPEYMTRRVRVRCARCRTVNTSAELPVQGARRPLRRQE